MPVSYTHLDVYKRHLLGSLIGLLERLGVNERLVRTTVFRLAKDDWLLAETEGRRSNYVLSPIGRRRFDERCV